MSRSPTRASVGRSTPRRSSRSPRKTAGPTPAPTPRRKPSLLQQQLSLLSLADTANPTDQVDGVVLVHLDSRTVRVGLPGESRPRFVLRDDNWLLDYSKTTEPDVLTEFASALETVLRKALLEHVLVEPAKQRVVVVVPSGIPEPLRNTIVGVVLGALRCTSVAFQSGPVCAAVAAGTRDALVVQLEATHAVVVPVYDLREIEMMAAFTVRSDLLSTEDRPDNDETNLVDLIVQTVQRLDRNLRRPVLDNVIVTGPRAEVGVALMEALQARVAARAVYSLGEWAGASLYFGSVGWRLRTDAGSHMLVGETMATEFPI